MTLAATCCLIHHDTCWERHRGDTVESGIQALTCFDM